MMVEMALESSQDFSMSNGSLPQWKRELLQRRAARPRTAPPTPPPTPAPPAAPPAPDEDEELRYGPGIVKRLKSRYLSLALRDAPRRRPSVLRRAASLEHLLDERPPPAPRATTRAPAPRVPLPAARRDAVKRARSVDALSRLEPCDVPPPSPPPPPPPPPRPPAEAPPIPRAPRPPRRPAPLLRDAERPPLDVVRAALRKFEPTPGRRAPAAALRCALRGLEACSSTPEPRPRRVASPDAPAPEGGVRLVSRAALEGIARAGSTTRYSFPAAPAPARLGEHLPPLAAANPVLLGKARRVGVIRPMPPQDRTPSASEAQLDHDVDKIAPDPPKIAEDAAHLIEEPLRVATPPPPPADPEPEPRSERRDSPPSALVEPIPRPPPDLPPPPVPSSPPPAIVPEYIPELMDINPCILKPEPPRPEPRKIDFPKPELPKAESPKPELVAKPKLIPEVAKLKLIPEVAKPKLLPEVAKPKLIPEVAKPKLIPEVAKPKVIPEVAKPKLIPEVAKPKLQPEAVTGAQPLMNGHSEPGQVADSRARSAPRIDMADIERAWTGADNNSVVEPKPKDGSEVKSVSVPWARGSGVEGGSPGGARRGPPPPVATSVVFNFSSRKEVPDYIENDGLILRASRRDRIKAGEPGVVVLRPEALSRPDDDSDSEEVDCSRPPSPLGVRFVNDNVLINGRSSMLARPNRDRLATLKLQFDDSLTRTFEYPSETSLCLDDTPDPHPAPASPPPSPGTGAGGETADRQQLAEAAHLAPLAANTHIASAALARYTPHKTSAPPFQLGLSRRTDDEACPLPRPATGHDAADNGASSPEVADSSEASAEGAGAGAAGDVRPCGADAARSWSDARTLATDLLF